MNPALEREWFERPTLEVARDLLGCRLCRRVGDQLYCWPIIEVEAYDGPADRASHARAGRTKRTEVMFGPAGTWYVYLCYGVHWLLNVVTGPVDYPAAVLIRGAGTVRGPGRLTKSLDITGAFNARPAEPEAGLWISPGPAVDPSRVQATPRIGIDYAGPDWRERPYRLVVD